MSPASHMVGRLKRLYKAVVGGTRFHSGSVKPSYRGRAGTATLGTLEQLEPRILLSGDAFQADIDWLYYSDGTGREISYDFSDGSMSSSGGIDIPPSAMLGTVPSEHNPIYQWGPGIKDEQVALDTDAGLYSMAIAQPLADAPLIPQAAITIDGDSGDWDDVPIYIHDRQDAPWTPLGSDLGDIKVAYSPDNSRLNVLLGLQGPVESSIDVVYRLNVYPQARSDNHFFEIIAQLGPTNQITCEEHLADGSVVPVDADGIVIWTGDSVEMSIAAAAVGLPSQAPLLDAETGPSTGDAVYDQAGTAYKDSSGWASIGGVNISSEWSGDWTWAVRIAGIENAIQPDVFYGVSIGTGSWGHDSLYPDLQVGCYNGVYEGVDFSGKLMLFPSIDSNDDTYYWHPSGNDGPTVVPGTYDLATTTLDLKIEVTNGGRTVNYFYRVSSSAPDEKGTWDLLQTHILPDGIAEVMRSLGGDAFTAPTLGIEAGIMSQPPVEIVGRYTFYNGSVLDGSDEGANGGDDAAIAVNRTALLQGQADSPGHCTGYSRGITGIMVDVAGAYGLTPEEAAGHFAFATVTSAGEWQAAPAASGVQVRQGEGIGGSDRITFIWPTGAINSTWLQVSILDDNPLGPGSFDVFYFANLPGDFNGDGMVDISDLGILAGNYNKAATVTQGDANGDGTVDISDLGILAGNYNRSLPGRPVTAAGMLNSASGLMSADAAAPAAVVMPANVVPPIDNFQPAEPLDCLTAQVLPAGLELVPLVTQPMSALLPITSRLAAMQPTSITAALVPTLTQVAGIGAIAGVLPQPIAFLGSAWSAASDELGLDSILDELAPLQLSLLDAMADAPWCKPKLP